MSKNKKMGLITLALTMVIVVLGFMVPLASVTLRGCDSGSMMHERLHLILGQTIESKMEEWNSVSDLPNAGCSATTQYILYLF